MLARLSTLVPYRLFSCFFAKNILSQGTYTRQAGTKQSTPLRCVKCTGSTQGFQGHSQRLSSGKVF